MTKPKVCSVNGCERTNLEARGFCKGHYQRWLRSGEVGGPDLRPRNKTRPPCSVDGCDGENFAKGYCQSHYWRVRRNGEPGGLIARTLDSRVYPSCSVDGCEGDARVKGWCRRHYKRCHDTGDPGPAEFRTLYLFDGCTAPGCDREHQTGGYCDLHYRRSKRGVPVDSLRFAAMPKKRSSTNYAAAHRRVVAERGPAKNFHCPCGSPAAQWAYQHTDPSPLLSPTGMPYSMNVYAYLPMCLSCHNRLDYDLDEIARRKRASART